MKYSDEKYEPKYEIEPATAKIGYGAAVQALDEFMAENKVLVERLDVKLQEEFEQSKQKFDAEDRETEEKINQLRKRRDELQRGRSGCWFSTNGHDTEIFRIDSEIMLLNSMSLHRISRHWYDRRYSTRLRMLHTYLREQYALGSLSASNLRLTKREIADLQSMIDGTWLAEHSLVKEIRKAAEKEAA